MKVSRAVGQCFSYADLWRKPAYDAAIHLSRHVWWTREEQLEVNSIKPTEIYKGRIYPITQGQVPLHRRALPQQGHQIYSEK